MPGLESSSDVRSVDVQLQGSIVDLLLVFDQIDAQASQRFSLKLEEWTQAEFRKLGSPGGRTDFIELANAGCAPEIIAGLLAGLKSAPEMSAFWTLAWKSPKERQKTRAILEKAAAALEALDWPAQIGKTDVEATLAKTGRIFPGRLASELRLYSSLFELLNLIPKKIQAHSLPECLRFLLVDYVHRATGHFHDRNVSALLAEVMGTAECSEEAQRMWRHRNHDRLNIHLTVLTDMLLTAGPFLPSKRNGFAAKNPSALPPKT
jgi:hypothetical protein